MPQQTATLAGGCFWCTEAIFQRLKGIASVTPGYTNAAESVQIIFDPQVISYEKLLAVFFHLHDPTTQNRQGPDVGPEYRSAIFYHDDIQKQIAEKLKSQVSGAVTEIISFQKFFPAEDYHKNYYNTHPNAPYCRVVIDPKLRKLFTDFKPLIKP